MGDDNGGPPLHQRLQGVLDGVLGDGVQGGGGLVQDQDLGILEDDPGDGEALLLAAGELEAPVAHHGVQALGLGGEKLGEIGDVAGGLDLLLGGVLLGVEQVLPDRAVEEIAVLGHDADLLAQIAQIEVPHVHPRDRDPAAQHVVEPGDEVHDGGFAGAGGSHNGVHLPAGDGEVNVGEQRLLRIVGEGHMLVADIRVGHVRPTAVFRGGDGIFQIEIVKNAGEEGQRAGEVHMDVQQALHRAVEAVDEGDGGGDGADGQGRIGLGDDEPAAGKVDEQRTDLGEHAHQDPEPAAAVLLPEGELGDLLVDRHKALVLPLLPGEELHQQRSADREGLVDELVHLVVFGLGVGEDLVALLAHTLGGQDQQRDHHDAHQGQLPAHGKEGRERGHHGGDVGDDAGERPGDHGAHAADIGVHAGDDVALLFRGEEGVGHVLQMVVHLVFHVEDDPLGDPGVDVALQHGDDLGGGQSHEGEKQELDQQLHVLAHQRLVHNAPGDDAGQQAQDRREQDRHEDQQELRPVGLEVGEDTQQQIPGYGGQIFLFLVRQKSAGPEPARGRRHGITTFRVLLPPFYGNR